MKVSVFVKEPGNNLRHVNISCSLNNLQKTVGGYIEHVSIDKNIVAVCDEEGKLKNKEFCCCVCGINLVGTVVFVGIDEEKGKYIDVPYSFEEFKKIYEL